MKIETLFELVQKHHWSQERYKRSGWAKEVTNSYNRHIGPTFGQVEAEEITRFEVKIWHHGISKTPYGANRALEVFTKIFDWGVENEKCKYNPCIGVKPFNEKKRKRYASEVEIQKIAERLEHYESHGWVREVTFVWALLLTGARPRSLERAKWTELVDMTDGSGFLITAGKMEAETGEDDEIVFPPTLMAKVQKLHHNNEFVFGGIKLPRYLWEKIRKESGCEDLRARDLRRTFATIGLSNGVALDTIGEVLNHKSVQTTKTYAKVVNTKKIEAVGQIANNIAKIIGSKK